MPKGQKLIDWTAENDARLILTILAVEDIHPNCERVAAAFGGAVNAMAISNRLSRLRRKAAEEGLIAKGEAAGPTSGRKSGASATKGNGMKKGDAPAEASLRANRKDSDGAPPTRKAAVKGQKVLTGRVTKGRDPAKSHGKIPRDVKVEVEDDGPDAAEGSERMEETEEDEEEEVEDVEVEEDGVAVVKKEEEV